MSKDHTLRVYDSILGLVSDEDNPTPLVRLTKVVPFQHARVYAKLEWYNPFGAVKDRIALNLIRDAEERGVLSPGKKLVEATSGNTGFGLAMVGNLKGYPLQTPLSKAIPLEKRTVLRFFGADVIELDDSLCPAPGAPEGAIAMARGKAQNDPDYTLLDQYSNPANPEGHYLTTGPEIWKQTEGKVTHFAAGLGTCGTITGTSKFLREKNPDLHVIAVYPEDGHSIPGVRSLRQLSQTRFYNPDDYSSTSEVSNREAFEMCLRLNREEGIIAGPSSAMALIGALRNIPDTPDTIAVVIFPDNVFKYASTIARLIPGMVQESADEPAGLSKNDRFLADMLENLKNPYDSMAVDELAKGMETGDVPVLVDVRSAERYASSHIPEAINIPEDDLSDRAGSLPEDRDAPIVMVCDVGRTSKRAVLYLKSLGYRNVRNLKGGISEWIRKGLSLETEEDSSEEASRSRS